MPNTITYNPVVDKSFKFSLKIIEFADALEEKRKYVLSRQLYKSGTSIGANIREAQEAESKADFIHKMKISLKEAEETEYWLLLSEMSPKYPSTKNLLTDLKELKKLLNSIIATSKRKK